MITEELTKSAEPHTEMPVAQRHPELVDTLTQHPLVAKLMSKEVKFRLKVAISIVLFASLFIFGKVDLREAWQAACNANQAYLIGALVIFLSSVFLNAHRWQLLASAVGLKKSLLQLVQYCYVGLFFNLFLPSTVGGDVSRCYYLSKGTGKYINAFYSVVADRAAGISVLFLMASAGLLFGPGGAGLPWQLRWPIFAGTVLVFGLLPFVPKLASLILGKDNWVSRQLNESVASIYWRNKNLVLVSFAWSIILQVVIVVCHVAVGMALGLNQVPLWYYFVFYPSVAVLGFITPTFNGIGIREWSYTYFLMLMGVDKAHAVTYAIIWFGLITLTSLVGGLVYGLGHFKISAAEMEKIQSESLH